MDMKMKSTSSPIYSVTQLAMLLDSHRTTSLRLPSTKSFRHFPCPPIPLKKESKSEKNY